MVRWIICGEEKSAPKIKHLENGLDVCGDCLLQYGEPTRCDCGAPLFGDEADDIECEACRERRDDEELEGGPVEAYELCERCGVREAGLDGLCEECESDLDSGDLE